MITVKLFGLLRLSSGIRELRLEAVTVSDLLRHLEARGLDGDALAGCNILINGERVTRRSRLSDGDTVQLFPPVAGG